MKDKDHAHYRHDMPDPEQIGEILSVVRKEVPGLVRDIVNILYSEQAAKNMGKAVGIYYQTLQKNGIPKDVALEMTKGYVIDMSRMFNKSNWGGHHHD
jgi:hypothetical protein